MVVGGTAPAFGTRSCPIQMLQPVGEPMTPTPLVWRYSAISTAGARMASPQPLFGLLLDVPQVLRPLGAEIVAQVPGLPAPRVAQFPVLVLLERVGYVESDHGRGIIRGSGLVRHS